MALLLWVGSLFQAGAISAIRGAVARRVGIADPAGAVAWLKGGDTLWLRLATLAVTLVLMLAIVWRRHRAAVVATWVLCGVAVADPLSVNAGLFPTLPASRLGPPAWVEATRAHAADRSMSAASRPGCPRQQIPVEVIDSPSRFPPLADMDRQEAMTTFSAQFALAPAAWRLREVISYDLRSCGRANTWRCCRRSGTRLPPTGFASCTGPATAIVSCPSPRSPARAVLSRSDIVAPMTLYECYTDPRRVYAQQLRSSSRFSAARSSSCSTSGRSVLDRAAREECTGTSRDDGPRVLAGSASIVYERNGELTVRVAVPGEGGYLNVVDSYDPFWTVDVDGRRERCCARMDCFAPSI